MMQYKGYCGVIEVDEDAGILHGRVLGLRDVITFQGETVAAARRAFEESVDDYLDFCADSGEAPEKPYSGKFIVRIAPVLHRQIATLAEARHVSLNTAVEDVLRAHVDQGATNALVGRGGRVRSNQRAGKGGPDGPVDKSSRPTKKK